MNPIWSEIGRLLAAHPRLALATIVARQGSAPRLAGTRMLVLPDGRTLGTVGGGRYEAECIQACQDLLKRENEKMALCRPAQGSARGQLRHFSLQGVGDMDMVCGGSLVLLLEPLSARRQRGLLAKMREAEARSEPWAFITRIGKEEGEAPSAPEGAAWVSVERFLYLPEAGLFSDDGHWPLGQALPLPEAALAAVQKFYARGCSEGREPELLALEDGEYLLEFFPRPYQLLIFGAGHISRALASLAHTLGLGTTVLDDRPEFASRERFPFCRAETLPSLSRKDAAAFLAGAAPRAKEAIIIVTRGHAHDRDVLAAALGTEAGYIGMIGSTRKRESVYASLRRMGFTGEDFTRVRSPIGVDIGAETPEEIAVSIAAELIQWRRGRLFL